MKKFLLLFLYICLLILVVIGVVDFMTGMNPISYISHMSESHDSISSLAACLNEDILNENEGYVSYYIKGISDKDLQMINYNLNNINGSITSIKVFPELFGIRKIDFEIQRSDNSYVIEAYKNNKPIPEDRVQAIRLYHEVRDILDNNIKGPMTDYDKELRLHDYIINHCEYSFGSEDNDNEYRAYGALVDGKAVCNGYAEAFSLLLSCAGIENSFVVGTADNGDSIENHAWNQVKIKGKWYNVDTTWDDPVGKVNMKIHAYFNVTDEVMATDHDWDKASYKKCDDQNWNYYHHEKLFFNDENNMLSALSIKARYISHGMIEVAYSDFCFETENLSEIYNESGVESISYMTLDKNGYKILVLVIN